MRKLVILYDVHCFFCRECRDWLSSERAYLELDFLPAQSPKVAERFPGLDTSSRPEELVVVSDEGGVYRGPKAYLMCLYALERYRELSLWLAKPWLLPLARRAFEVISRRRGCLSRLLTGRREVEKRLVRLRRRR